MKVVLLTHVRNLGQKGEIKEVSTGYYQNFLAPRKLAMPATDSQVSHIRAQQSKATEKLETMKESALSVKAKVDGKTVTLQAKAGETGKLYASLHEKDIAAAMKRDLNVEIPEKQIKLKEAIKALGAYPISVKLYKEISANFQVNVIAE
ncbi:MAG: 50S ribosomal protein L9 [Candidatus Gracilibacteria bacterium]